VDFDGVAMAADWMFPKRRATVSVVRIGLGDRGVVCGRVGFELSTQFEGVNRFRGIGVGLLASIVLGTKATQGLLADISLGVIGAIVGGLILNLVGQTGMSGFNLYSISIATLGAVVLIWFGRVLNETKG
jgi:uncharacterized membrane protein YeaQ/YmgE (transglycosylase-associated protein family)